MRKFGEYVRVAYGCFSAKWIFGVLAALSLLPALTKTVLLCITKESLTAGAGFLQTCSALSAPVYTFIPGYVLPIEGHGMVIGGLVEKELLRQAELLCADGKERSREGI